MAQTDWAQCFQNIDGLQRTAQYDEFITHIQDARPVHGNCSAFQEEEGRGGANSPSGITTEVFEN